MKTNEQRNLIHKAGRGAAWLGAARCELRVAGTGVARCGKARRGL